LTNNAYLLDINAAIAYIDGDKRLETTLNEAEERCTSVIVLGELYYGAENSLRIQENLAQVEKFAANVHVLNSDPAAARHFGKVNRQLRFHAVEN